MSLMNWALSGNYREPLAQRPWPQFPACNSLLNQGRQMMPAEQVVANFAQPGNGRVFFVKPLALNSDALDCESQAFGHFRVFEQRPDDQFKDLYAGLVLFIKARARSAQGFKSFGRVVFCPVVFHEGSPVSWLGLQIGRLPAHCNDAG